MFFDTNGDGVYTSGTDQPLANIGVSLYYDANGDGVAQPGEFVAADTTDATGAYLFSGLTPERYIVVVDAADSDLPGGVQGLVPQYVRTLASGEDYRAADFPFVELFTKTADKTAALPGDIITYTLNLNLPGDQLYQNLKICDPIPSGDVSFVGASAGAVIDGGYTPTGAVNGSRSVVSSTVLDQFNTNGSYAGNNGTANWLANWAETGDDGLANGGGILVAGNILRFDFNNTTYSSDGDFIERSANLSEAASATLTYNLSRNELDSGEYIYVEVKGSGTAWVLVDTITLGTAVGAKGGFDLKALLQAASPAQSLANSTTIRFRRGVGLGDDQTEFDNVQIAYATPSTTTAIAVTPAQVASGGTATVKMTVGSSVAMTNVAPGSLTPVLAGGATATLASGPTPSSASIAAGGTAVFTWTYTVADTATPAGTVQFSGAATGTIAGGTSYTFASATSATAQVLPAGAVGTVCWNLGSHTQAVDGLRIAGASLYAFRGGDAAGGPFWKYDPTTATWNTPTDPADFAATVNGGGSLTTDGTYIYALQGDGTKVVKRYDPVAGTWAALPLLADSVKNGGAIAFHAADGKLYVLRGDRQKTFSQFTFTAPGSLTGTWIKTIAQLPVNVGDGGALVSVGNYLYALQGDGKRGLYRYDPAGNAWTALALTPGNVDDGGALVAVGNYLYAFQGKTATFWRYDIAANTWTTMAAAPAAVGPGAALTAVGDAIFAFRGNGAGTDLEFWRYSTTTNTWLARTNAPGVVGWGGSLVALGTPRTYTASVDVSPAIVVSGRNVTATYTVSSSEAVNNFSPPASLTATATGGAVATLVGSVSPAGPVNLAANTPQTFTYTYTITAGTPPTGVTFSVAQRDSGTSTTFPSGVTWPTAAAHNVIAVPPLTLQVKVGDSPTGLLVDNNATVTGVDKAAPDTCYVVANGSGTGTDVDVLLRLSEDGTVTRVGVTGTTQAKSLVLSPDGSVLYTTDRDATVGAGSDRFGVVNPTTGAFTYVNRLVSTANLLEGFLPGNVAANFAVVDVVGMAFDPASGRLYAIAQRQNVTLSATLDDLLFVINPATGLHVEDAFGPGLDYLSVRTDLLATPLYDIDDITFDPATGKLYAIASNSTANLGGSRLVTINPATGAVTDIGRLTRSDTLAVLDNAKGLTFSSNGTLHATTGGANGVGTPANTYWIVDKATAKATLVDFTTGDGTHITDPSGNVYDFQGVACISDDIPINATDGAVTSLKGTIGDLVWADANGDGNHDPTYTVINGLIDIANDGAINGNDDGILGSVRVIDGKLDLDGDGSITAADDGMFQGYTVTDGVLTGATTVLAETGIGGVRVYADLDNDGMLDWADADGDGIWDPTEGEPWTTTNASGEYTLYGFSAGTYTVRYDAGTTPTGYVPSSPTSVSATLANDTSEFTAADFGLRPGLPPNLDSTIGDLVWVDRNGNGIFDTGDQAIADVSVKLYLDMDSSGTLTAGDVQIGTDVTDAEGNYLFTGLNSGNHLVQVDQSDPDFPAGLALTGTSPAQPNPEAVTLGVAEDKLTVDFAYDYSASIGDFVWYDNNGNGVYDTGEDGVANAHVMLFEDTNGNGIFDGDIDVQIASAWTTYLIVDGKIDINTDGVIDAADDGAFQGKSVIDGLVDVNGDGVITSADDLASLGGYPVVDGYLDVDGDGVTAGDAGDDLAAGGYLHDNLPYGTYFVQVYEQSVKPDGDPTGLPNLLPTTDTMMKVVLAPASSTYLDADFGFKQGSTIEGSLFHDVNHDGVYEPNDPGTPEPGLAGITVWIDADGDGTLDWADGNSNGVWDEGEGEQWTVTDANGDYKLFVTEVGSYLVRYDINDPDIPAALQGTLAESTPTAQNVVISVLGEQKVDIDFGRDNTGSIGDLVFGDRGTVGAYDGSSTDPGLPGVVVELYLDSDNNGAFDPATDAYIATTTTDAAGNYLFPGLPDGSYLVHVLPQSMPAAWQTTPTFDPTSPPDGVGLATVSGGVPVTTMDFGYPPQQPGSLSGMVFNDGGPTALGNGLLDYAIIDGKIDINRDGVITTADDGEYDGYTVIDGLVDWDGSGVVDDADDTLTDFLNGFVLVNGYFDIDRDNAVGEPTDDATIGTPVVTGKLDVNRDGVVDGNDDGTFRGYTVIDGLVDVDGSGTITAADDLANLGGYPVVDGYIDIDRDGVTAGDTGDIGGVAGDTPIAGVVINLYDATGIWVASTTTDASGAYRFDGLRPGTYTVEETNPPGAYSVTDKELDTVDPAANLVAATVTAGLTSIGNDFLDDGAYVAPLSGQVRNDIDADGNLADSELGISGVTIRLFQDLNGDGTTPLLGVIDGKIDVDGDGSITSADTGTLHGLPVIAGQVDVNNDGSITAADDLASFNGVQVIDGLLDIVPGGGVTTADDGTIGTEPLVATTVTDASGNYSFANLSFGDYVVVESDPAGAISTADVAGTNDNQIGVSISYGGESGIDFLDSLTGTVGGFLYADVNGDGVYTAGTDTPLAYVDVLVEDSAGRLITVATDANGNWTATVPPGQTTASVVLTDPQFTAAFPNGYVQTDGTNPTTVVAVGGSAVSAGNDGWFSPYTTTNPASIAGAVYNDTDLNGFGGTDAPVAGVVVDLYLDTNGDQLVPFHSVTDGLIGTFTGTILDYAIISGAVDLDGSGTITAADDGYFNGIKVIDGKLDLDGSGTVDANDDGMVAGEPLVAQDVTTSSGGYAFANLPAASYVVVEHDPAGATSVDDRAAGTEFPGTDADNQVGVVLSASEASTGNDFLDSGVMTYAVSGKVLNDTDTTGGFSGGDTPIASVTVGLYADFNGDGVVNPEELAAGPVATTTTDYTGAYAFPGLAAGAYIVVETDPAGATSILDADSPSRNGPNQIAVTVTNADVTDRNFLDAGMPPGSIGNLVFQDYNHNGVYDAGTDSGINGIAVELYLAGQTPGTDEPVATTVAAGGGAYAFTDVPPGEYVVYLPKPETGMPGVTSPSVALDNQVDNDSNGSQTTLGGPVTSPVITLGGGESEQTIDFGFACQGTWEEWQYLKKLGEQGDPTDNPDGDRSDNLLEYALKGDATSGTGDLFWIRPSATVPGTMEAVFLRPIGATADVNYVLQYAAALGLSTSWTTVTQTPENTTVTQVNACTEEVVITGLTGTEAFVRLTVELDANGDDVVDATSSTEVEGWTETGFVPASCRTYNLPYLREPVFTGTVATVDGQGLTFAGENLGTLLAPGVPYYLEVTSGDNAGQRFDVVSATGTTITLASDTSLCGAVAPFNTLTGAPPASLADDTVVVRRHWTLGEVFPAADFTATDDKATADQIQVYTAGGWVLYWLYDAPSGPNRWVLAGDTNYADQGGQVLPPGQGVFLNTQTPAPPAAAENLLAYGEVRANDFIRPLCLGHNLVGGGFPVDQSATGTRSREMNLTPGLNDFFGSRDFKTADSFFLWKGDADVLLGGYDTYYLLSKTTAPVVVRWVKVGDATLAAQDAQLLFLGDRSVFIRVATDHHAYRIPCPWAP